MADISKITLPDSSEYNIKDATARSIANGKSTVSVSQTLTSGTEIGSVTVDGTATKLYAPQGGSADALTDPEIEAAVDDAFPQPQGKTVTVSLTNPQNASSFIKVSIYEYNDGENMEPLGIIESATGSLTVDASKKYLDIQAMGAAPFVDENQITVTGGVIYNSKPTDYEVLFEVNSSGTITIDGIDYDY